MTDLNICGKDESEVNPMGSALQDRCPMCEGSGELDDGGSEFRDREYFKCSNCKGTGKVSAQKEVKTLTEY